MTEHSESRPALWRITTQWSRIHDPSHFVLRYADAARRYLLGILRDPHLVDDSLQQLLLQVSERGFANADPARGRFRDYLIRIVRNQAQRSLRAARPQAEPLTDDLLEQLASSEASPVDEAWLNEWRQCLLDRAFRALHVYETQTPGNHFFSLLRLATAQPQQDQMQLADEFNRQQKLSLSFDAFRKQLSRARRKLAELLVVEVARTLDSPCAADVEEELAAIGLLSRVTPFLPADWRSNPKLVRDV